MPAAAGLVLLRRPIVALLYQRGEFTAQSTDLVAWALLWYAAGLVGHSMVEVLARAFYALHDTRTPVIVGATAMGLNVGLSFLFVWLFSSVGWMPHGGLALANSTATALEMIGLLVLIRRNLGGLEGMRILKAFWQGAIGVIVMTLAIVGFSLLAGNMRVWIQALAGVAIGVAFYAGSLLVTRTAEIHYLIAGIRRRVQGLIHADR
jgi:putative peptidoglycan lipid II flippase